jgi:diadenosine tetraphosphate (Ap4A) HIT family hydrolase
MAGVTHRREIAPACTACDLMSGALPLPGGTIYRTDDWAVEHCVGPPGVGSLIVKPIRHVVHLAELTADEAAKLGSLLRAASSPVTELTDTEQVYACLWSHAGGQAGHIHFVVQPVGHDLVQRFGAHGAKLQVAMFEANEAPPRPEVEAFAARAAAWLAPNAPTQP